MIGGNSYGISNPLIRSMKDRATQNALIAAALIRPGSAANVYPEV